MAKVGSPPAEINDLSHSPVRTPVKQVDPVVQTPLAEIPPAPEPVIEPKTDNPQTNIASETKLTSKTKTSKKHSHTVPEDSIKFRLRNATLKPFKFLKK